MISNPTHVLFALTTLATMTAANAMTSTTVLPPPVVLTIVRATLVIGGQRTLMGSSTPRPIVQAPRRAPPLSAVTKTRGAPHPG